MNRTYKLIWSKIKHCYVVASELAKSCTKGCSRRRTARMLATGAAVAVVLLPAGSAGAFSSSYVPNYNSASDYMTDGGTVYSDNIGYTPGQGGESYIFVSGDGTVSYDVTEGFRKQDVSVMAGNVAVGNFASAGSEANFRYIESWNGLRPAFETQPAVYAGTVTHNGKTYYYTNSWYYPNSMITMDGKNYLMQSMPVLDENGNPTYDGNGNMVYENRYSEIGEKIWKEDPDNAGSLTYDFKNVDENGNPVFDLTEEDMGLEYGLSNNVAVGNRAATTSHSSVAVGDSSTARGWRSVAIGADAQAGTENGGDWNNGTSAVAIGDSSKAFGSTSVAVGQGAATYSFSGIAVGNNANASTEFAIAIGDNARVSYIDGADDDETKNIAVHGIAIGRDAVTEGKDGTAVGRQSQALMRNATAYGNNAHADGFNSVAIGNKAIAGSQDDTGRGSSSLAVGNRATAIDEYTTAVGPSTYAEGFHSVAVGDSNRAVGRFSTAVGAGWSEYTVDEDDNDNTEALRQYTARGANQAVGDYSTAVGYGNATPGDNSTALGKQNAVSGENSIGIGTSNVIGSVVNPGATGELTAETDKGDITGFALGNANEVTGNLSGAFGDSDSVGADNSYVFGNNSKIEVPEAKGSFVLGNDASATVEKSVAIGSDSVADRDVATEAGYDVTTGKSYAGTGSDTATWKSTRGAVSVGDAANGVTRQITGVAAGLEDTDAVNVAQLKLARTEVKAGTNVTVDQSSDETDGHAIYTVNGLKTVVTSTDGSVEITPTNEDNADKTGVITYDLKVKPATNVSIKEGDNVTVTSETDENNFINYTINATNTVTNVEAGDNVTVDEKIDGDKITYTVNATDTTYKVDAEAGEEGSNIVNNYTMTGTNGDTYTLTDTDTTYKVTSEAGGEGTNVVNTYTMTGTNGDKYTFTDTDTDTTYKVETKRVKEGTVAATTTITDSNGNKVGEFEDTHNGLKNDTNTVEYDDNGVGSVTITDQDGNTTTINGIRTGDDMAVTRLGDRINRLDKRINKVGAGAAALAALHPLDFDPDEKWDFSAGAGSYKGEHAVALGAFYRPNEDTMFSIGGTIGNGDNMVNVGVSWKFGQKNRISANRISSAKEIIELRKNQENVHSFLADAVAGNQLDLSKIQLFPDVEENHWAYDYVATMAGNGVLEGYPDGYFKGNRNMTRYEMAAVLYRLMQNGARLSDRALTEFAPELDRIRVDTITQHKDGTPHIQRVRTIKERVDEKADPSSEKAAKKKAKVKVAEKPVE
ncbi:MAG: YadA-like family protein [Acidaminococcaceae bacterium]|nr:YadA-like family protein [Acidaminococcaceae bacterium]